jgi:hypothetical protein
MRIMGRSDQTYCQYCGDPLDAGSEFSFLVEAQIFNEEVAPLELVQRSPHYHGEPLRVCKRCRDSIEQNRLDLLERAAREEAQSRRYWKVWLISGFVAVVIILASIIDGLRR